MFPKIPILNLITKNLLISSVFTAFLAFLTLEIFRIYSPLDFLDVRILRNSISILFYVLPPLILNYLIVEKEDIIQMLYRGSIFSIISWFFWILLIGLVLIIRSMFFSNTIIYSFDYFVPLIASIFIFFLIGGILSSLFKYLKTT